MPPCPHGVCAWQLDTQVTDFPFDVEENAEDKEAAKQNGSSVWAPSAGANGSMKMPSMQGSSIAPGQKHSILYYRMLTVRQMAGAHARKAV